MEKETAKSAKAPYWGCPHLLKFKIYIQINIQIQYTNILIIHKKTKNIPFKKFEIIKHG